VAQADDAPFRAYVNVLLSDAQKEGYDEWAVSEFYWQTFDSMVADGVGLSVKREPKNGGFLASGTQRDPKSPNAGLVVTARGGSAATSLGRLLYTLSYLSTGDTWEAVVPIVATDRW
jgi:hypothetical protein